MQRAPFREYLNWGPYAADSVAAISASGWPRGQMQYSVSIFCVSASSGSSIQVRVEIVDVCLPFPVCVDQVVSQLEPIYGRRPRGLVRVVP